MNQQELMEKQAIQSEFFGKNHQLQSDKDLAATLCHEQFVSLIQTHSKKAVILREPSKRQVEADAVFTDVPDVTLTIRAADCQQLLFMCKERGVVGAVHAGWKGLKKGIIESAFKALQEEWNINPEEVEVVIGPSLCTQCAEFSDPSLELDGLDATFFHGRHADLRGMTDVKLTDAGVQKEYIRRHPDCTKCKNSLYWSYRGGDKQKVKEGFCNVMAITMKTL